MVLYKPPNFSSWSPGVCPSISILYIYESMYTLTHRPYRSFYNEPNKTLEETVVNFAFKVYMNMYNITKAQWNRFDFSDPNVLSKFFLRKRRHFSASLILLTSSSQTWAYIAITWKNWWKHRCQPVHSFWFIEVGMRAQASAFLTIFQVMLPIQRMTE